MSESFFLVKSDFGEKFMVKKVFCRIFVVVAKGIWLRKIVVGQFFFLLKSLFLRGKNTILSFFHFLKTVFLVLKKL